MSENTEKKTKHPGRRFMIIFLIVVLVFLPVSNAAGYEVVFRVLFTDTMRDIEKNEAEEASFLAENGLKRQEYTIAGSKGSLQGYLYTKDTSDTADCTDMIVFSHGIGNGHIAYLSWIGEFMTLPGTCVFTYDATGNGRSDGKATGGLPQGVKDLDAVLNFIESDETLKRPEITLVGHSWGAFSAGSVLEFHPEIRQAALFCGFNASENMLQTYAQKYAGPVVYLFLPYVELYEMLKFGKYGNASIVRGCLQSGARVIFTQPLDDKTVDPQKFGIKYLEKELSEDEETSFIELSEGGHTPSKEVVMESLHQLRQETGKE